MQSVVISIGGIISMMVFWSVVQSVWKKTFGRNSMDDALDGRSDCGSCNCQISCKLNSTKKE